MDFTTPEERKFLNYYQQKYYNPGLRIGDLRSYMVKGNDGRMYLDEETYGSDHEDEIFTNYYRTKYKDISLAREELDPFIAMGDDGRLHLDEDNFEYNYGMGKSWRKYGFDLNSSVDMFQRFGEADNDTYKGINPYADYEKYTPKQWNFQADVFPYDEEDPLDMARARRGYAPGSLLWLYDWSNSEDVKRFKAGDMPLELENAQKGREALRETQTYYNMLTEFDRGLQEWQGSGTSLIQRITGLKGEYPVNEPQKPVVMDVWESYLMEKDEYEQELRRGDASAYDLYMGKGPKEPPRPDFAYEGFEDDIQFLQDVYAQNRAANAIYRYDAGQEEKAQRAADIQKSNWGPIDLVRKAFGWITGGGKKETKEESVPTREELAGAYLDAKAGKGLPEGNKAFREHVLGGSGDETVKGIQSQNIAEKVLRSVPSMEYVYRGNGKTESGVKWVYDIASGKWMDVVAEDPKKGILTVSDNGKERDVYSFMVSPYEVAGENLQKAFSKINPEDHKPYKGEWLMQGVAGGQINTLSGMYNAVRGLDNMLGLGISEATGLDQIVSDMETMGESTQLRIEKASKAGQLGGDMLTQAIPVLYSFAAGQALAAPFQSGGAVMGATQSFTQSVKSGVAAGRAVQATKAAATVAGRTPFFTYSFGSYYREAENDGATPGQAGTYGLTMAMVETLTEMPIIETAFGGGLSEALTGNLMRSGASKILKMAGSHGITAVFTGMAEGVQEVLAGGIGSWMKNLVYDPEYDPMEYDLEAMGQDFIGGAMMGLMFMAAGLPSSTESYKASMQQYERMAKGEGIDMALMEKMPDYLREDIRNMQLAEDIGKVKEAMAQAAGVDVTQISDADAQTFIEAAQADAEASLEPVIDPKDIRTTEELETSMDAVVRANIEEAQSRVDMFEQVSAEQIQDGQVVTPNVWQLGEYTITQEGTGEDAKYLVQHPTQDDLKFDDLTRAENYVLEETGALLEAAHSEIQAAEPVQESENPTQSKDPAVAARAQEIRNRIKDPTDFFGPRMMVDLQFKGGPETVVIMDSDETHFTIEREDGRLGNVLKDRFINMITDESLVNSIGDEFTPEKVYNKSGRILTVRGGDKNAGENRKNQIQDHTADQRSQEGDGSGENGADEAGAQNVFNRVWEEIVSEYEFLGEASLLSNNNESDISREFKARLKKQLGVDVFYFRSDVGVLGIAAPDDGYIYINETFCSTEQDFKFIAAHETYHIHAEMARKIIGTLPKATASQRRAYINSLDATDEYKSTLTKNAELCTEEMEADLFASLYSGVQIKTYLDNDYIRAFRDKLDGIYDEIRRVNTATKRGPPVKKTKSPSSKVSNNSFTKGEIDGLRKLIKNKFDRMQEYHDMYLEINTDHGPESVFLKKNKYGEYMGNSTIVRENGEIQTIKQNDLIDMLTDMEVIDIYKDEKRIEREKPPRLSVSKKETVAGLKKEVTAQRQRAEKAERKASSLERRLDQVTERLEKKALNTKQHYITKEARAQERRKESEVRKRLLKAVQDLKKQAPKMQPVFKNAAIEIVDMIDSVAMSMTAVKEAELLTIKPAIEKLKAEYGAVYAERHILNQLERLDKIQIKSMDIEDVERMVNAVRALLQEDRNWKKANTLDNTFNFEEEENPAFFREHKRPEGEEYAFSREKGTAKDPLIYNTLGSGALRGETMARRMDNWKDDGPFQLFYKELTNGYRRYLEFQRDSVQYLEKHIGSLDQYKKWHGKNADMYAINLETGERKKIDRKNVDQYKDQKYIVLDRGGIVALSLHGQNLDNLRHIVYGGIAVDTTAQKSRYPRKLEVKDIAAISKSMNAEERKVAAALNGYFNEFTKPKINDVSLLEDGYERAVVDNYFPIYTDRMSRPDQRGGLAMKVLREMGMLKERTKGAKSAIILENVFDVFQRHSDMVGQYVGMELPLAAFTKWFGQVPIQRALAANYSQNDVRYWRDLFTYLDGNVDRSVDGFFTKQLNNFAGTVLGVNFGVMLKQLPSFVTAFAEIDGKYLAIGAIPWNSPKWKAIEKYSAELWQRRRGYILPEMQSNLAKGRRWATKGIIAFDGMAVGRIWNAVEAEIKDKRKDLTEGSDTYYEAVARRTEDIIHKTQPNYSPLYQPAIKRSGTFLSRVISMFSTQTNQNLNLIVEGIHDMVDLQTGKVRKETWKKGAKKLSGVVAASVMIALIQAMFRRIRHQDDEYKVKVQNVEEDRVRAGGRWYTVDELDRMGFDIRNIKEGKDIALGDGRQAFQRIARDTMGSLIGSVYLARDIYSIAVEGYDYALPTSESFNRVWTALKGSKKWSPGGHAVKIVEATSYFLGIPVANMNKAVKNSLLNIDYDMYAAYMGALTNEVPGDFYDDLWKSLEKGSAERARKVASATWTAYENSAESPKWSDFKGRIKSSGKARGYSAETIREALQLFQ